MKYLQILMYFLFSAGCVLFVLLFVWWAQNTEHPSGEPLSLSPPLPDSRGAVTLMNVSFCPSSGCLDLYLRGINQSVESVSCAWYDFTLEPLLHALLERHDQGVDVRLMVDDQNTDRYPIRKLKNETGTVRDDRNRDALYNNFMHHKFCVVDRETVILGSANPTYNGLFRHNNEVLTFKGEDFAHAFLYEFAQLYEGQRFGDDKESLQALRFPLRYRSHEGMLHVYFCPQDFCLPAVLKTMRHAETEILFASFVLTHEDIEEALLDANRRGVLVKGVVEEEKAQVRGSDVKALAKEGLVVYANNTHRLHHKLFIVDGRYVITGSMNPSRAGVDYNDEFLLILDLPPLAQRYREYLYEGFLLGD